MSQYTYSPLSPESNTTRMLRLLLDEDNAAPIKVQLFDYCLSKPGTGRHIYEALSYVWGSEKKPHSIFIDNHALPVTENLHAALLHLRNHQLERMLWVDAICIDQENDREKARQIMFMPMIYGQANRVIVWLRKEADHSSEALQNIRLAAEELPGEINHAAILMLLQRPWFRRIWVLHEVGLARSIMVMCGPVKMDGYTFCSGLERLRLSYEDHPDLQSQIRSVAYLMRGASFRPEYTSGSRGAHSIGELIDMYHAQESTKQHDKMYALLGMSSDDPNTAPLIPDYNLPWVKVLQQVIKHVLSKSFRADLV